MGTKLTGMGFTFDDVSAAKGDTASLATMRQLIGADARNAERIFQYVGGDEVNTEPCGEFSRFVIDFDDFPAARSRSLPSWFSGSDKQRQNWIEDGIVPVDYPEPVASDWPDLLSIIEQRVKPSRLKLKSKGAWSAKLAKRWWQHAQRPTALYTAVADLDRVLVRSLTSAHFPTFAFLPTSFVFDQTLIVFSIGTHQGFATLGSRSHEIWVRFLGATLEDRGRYNIADCFETFPFPLDFQNSRQIEIIARSYYDHRAALMVTRNEGMTKVYNRFHDQTESAGDIQRLRELHAAMDRAVLEAYGWHDLAGRAAPVFLDETNEDDHTYLGRLFWPSDFRDEVLARLLVLNAERAAAERAVGLTVAVKEDEDEIDEEVDA
jgi:hypothetical protein